jgi:hypothetical protein
LRALELDRPRTIRRLLWEAMTLWLRHLPVFFTLALIVVAPLALLIEGAWAGVLDGADGSLDGTALLAWVVAELLVIPALVTAMHVVAVVELGKGRRPSIVASAVAAFRSAPALVAIVFLYTVATAIGLVLFVLPGILVAVGMYFGAQVRMVEHRGVTDCLRRSVDIVAPHAGRAFAVQLLIAAVVFGLQELTGLVWAAVETGPAAATAYIAGSALIRSYTSLAATLLFFDLRARRASRPATWSPSQEPVTQASRPFS